MNRPNFLVIGAPRAGTTSLHHYLGQHPDVFMCARKEPSYFAFGAAEPLPKGPGARWLRANTVRDAGEYQRLFSASGGRRAVGEASPRYLSSAGAAERIYRAIPDARLIAVLRDPVERAFASFVAHRRDGWEPEQDLLSAVRDEPRRAAQGWAFGQLLSVGRYHAQLEAYFARFDRARIQIHLFEDFVQDPRVVLARICEFLDIDPGAPFDTAAVHNPTLRIEQPLLRALWTRSEPLRRALRSVVPEPVRAAAYRRLMREAVPAEFDPLVRQTLALEVEQDVLRLQDQIGRDLSGWLPVR